MDSNLSNRLWIVLAAGLAACGGGGSGDSNSGQGLLTVPDVVNLPEAEATAVLGNFNVVQDTSSAHPFVAAGRVISQSPAACVDCAEPDDAVRLLISQPYDYQVELPAHFLESPFPEVAGAPNFQPAVYPNTDNTGSNLTTDVGATLGRVLFYDTTLSIDRTVSCASCHLQRHGFSDPDILSAGVDGETRRHSMGLANARFFQSGKAFWDQRAASLEEQALIPIQDPVEMGLTLDELENRLASLDYYPNLFEAAFGEPSITHDSVAAALAQFVRSLVSVDSKYDQGRVLQRAFEGGPLSEKFFDPLPNFTDEENRGKEIFLRSVREGGGSCFSCHSTEAFINSVAGPTNNGLDLDTSADEGVCESSGLPKQCGTFKVPSLKNIAVRPPYMHDGRFKSLEEVIEHYNLNIQAHPNLGEALKDASGVPVRLNLADDDKAALIAFLNTLTDETMLNDPKFSDPFD